MPRQPRLDLPGIPQHITQRGVNRCAIFVDDHDRQHFLRLLLKHCRAQTVALHGYVLMDNHFHLLASSPFAGRLSTAMHRSGHAYVQAFNARHRRSGPHWQGRYKSCLVDSERYVLNVLRYIELNPVRAGIAESPEALPWSSVHAHVGRRHDPLLTAHPAYLALDADPSIRFALYRRWLYSRIDETELADIRRHLAQERALGDPRFQYMVARTLNRPSTCGPCGRPRRQGGARRVNGDRPLSRPSRP